jgi:phycocyanobilin lyase beta subunit
MTNDRGLKLIQSVEQADSSQKLLDAVQSLAAARLEEGIPTLIATLSYNNPGAAVAAVDGLVQLGEVAVPKLLNLLDDYNYSGRAWAIRALAGIGDPRALETLREAAETDFAMSVRRSAAKGLGNLRWSDLPAQDVPAAQALDIPRPGMGGSLCWRCGITRLGNLCSRESDGYLPNRK